MRIVRTLFAIAIGAALIGTPAVGYAAFAPAPAEMSMHHTDDMPCCPAGHEQDRSKIMACAIACMMVVGAIPEPAIVVRPRPIAERPSFFATRALHEYVASPPTHPPPV